MDSYIEKIKYLQEVGVTGIKADLEAEYFSAQDQSLIKDFSAIIDITVKIGGCEAINDFVIAKNINAKNIVAPMIESEYALKKFVDASSKIFDGVTLPNLYINIETKTAFEKLNELLDSEIVSSLKGIVIGRSDMARSLGLKCDDVNCDRLFLITKEILSKAKEIGIETIVGGNLSHTSMEFFSNLPDGLVDKVETRKVIFEYKKVKNKDIKNGINAALDFEMYILEQKHKDSKYLNTLDQHRLELLKKRKY